MRGGPKLVKLVTVLLHVGFACARVLKRKKMKETWCALVQYLGEEYPVVVDEGTWIVRAQVAILKQLHTCYPTVFPKTKIHDASMVVFPDTLGDYAFPDGYLSKRDFEVKVYLKDE